MALLQDADGTAIPNWGPASKLVAITPADATDLSGLKLRGLWVGGVGNVTVIALNDTAAVTLSAVPAGTFLPLMVKKVMAATTATLIVGLA
jgi:hypothetical protein